MEQKTTIMVIHFDNYSYGKKKKNCTVCLCLMSPFHKPCFFLALEVKLRRGGLPKPWAAPWAIPSGFERNTLEIITGLDR